MLTSYIALIVAVYAIEALALWRVRLAYSRCACCTEGVEEAGAVVARRMLRAYGVDEVAVHGGEQGLSDRYDRDEHAVVLSDEVYSSCNAAALAIACHECGHACQDAEGVRMLRGWGLLVSATRVLASAWVFVLILGIAMDAASVCVAGVAALTLAVACSLIALPVELDASKRALAFLESCEEAPVLPEQTMRAVREVLRAAAASYLAESLLGILDLAVRATSSFVHEGNTGSNSAH